MLELNLKALVMDCIHFIDVVQQLLAADTRSTKEWHWQKQLRWEYACAYICVHVCIGVQPKPITNTVWEAVLCIGMLIK